jgi:eukaryotic-like serine/threonine-protein kinase
LNELAPGSVIANRYRILRNIASGGMATVYEALEPDKKRRVALKVPHQAFVHDRRSMRRFMREARATLAIRSHHVIRTYAVGRLPSGVPFIAMEYVEGTPLRDLMYQGSAELRPMPMELALKLIDQVAAGLSAAHAVRVIHRDMKPENVLVAFYGDKPMAKVFDFGLSLAADTNASRLTEPNTTLGTPQYMPPEQAQSARAADARSDIYSVGIMAYEMLAAMLPFEGETPQEIWRNAWHGRAVPLAIRRPDLPPDVVDVINSCIARDPAARPQTLQLLRDAISHHLPSSERAQTMPPPAPPSLMSRLLDPWVIGAMAATVIALGLALILLLRAMQ